MLKVRGMWKGRINLYHTDSIGFTVNCIDEKHKCKFEATFPFYWIAKLCAKILSKKHNLPIEDDAMESVRFWKKYHSDIEFRINHLKKFEDITEKEAIRLAIEYP